jgi:hypothetical protein
MENARSNAWRILLVPLLLSIAAAAWADESLQREGMWLRQRDVRAGNVVFTYTTELTLHPRAETRPALQYRLLPDETDLVEGNAAIYYLKAMGFLEQDWKQQQLADFEKEAFQRAVEVRKATGNIDAYLPPYSWDVMAPGELPLEEVKKYLSFVDFQPLCLREAARRRVMDLDRQLQDSENPLGYPLPDIQEMRTLARMQVLRCKVAIAENRFDDAVEILGQLYAMARHLGQDETVVANLVGENCAIRAWEAALCLVQHRQAPNLYWGFAALPCPFIDARRSAAFERQMLYFQLPMLREVDETPKPAGYWQEFLDRLAAKLAQSTTELRLPRAWFRDPTKARGALVGLVASGYPDARRYLIEQCKLSREQVDAYPTAQVVLLAAVRYYNDMGDEVFKWSFLPHHKRPVAADPQWSVDRVLENSESDEWFGRPARTLFDSSTAFANLPLRSSQTIAMLQTVEAIRMYGAVHNGQLPEDLNELPVPAPLDPASGKLFAYVRAENEATLSCVCWPREYRLVLRFAEAPGK